MFIDYRYQSINWHRLSSIDRLIFRSSVSSIVQALRRTILVQHRCYKSIKRVEKIQEEAKQLKNELKRNFASTNRFKRGIPSDTSLSPNTLAPTKSARQDQMTNTRQRVAKSLNFRGGSQEERETSPLPNIVPLVALAASSSRVPLAMVPDFLPVAANIPYFLD